MGRVCGIVITLCGFMGVRQVDVATGVVVVGQVVVSARVVVVVQVVVSAGVSVVVGGVRRFIGEYISFLIPCQGPHHQQLEYRLSEFSIPGITELGKTIQIL